MQEAHNVYIMWCGAPHIPIFLYPLGTDDTGEHHMEQFCIIDTTWYQIETYHDFIKHLQIYVYTNVLVVFPPCRIVLMI